MDELNQHILKDKIQELPEYRPWEHVWKGIEHWLDYDDILHRKANQLHDYEVRDEVWDTVYNGLKRSHSKNKIFIQVLVAAASVVMFILIFRYTNQSENMKNVSVHEIKIPEQPELKGPNQYYDVQAYIDKICQLNGPVCEHPQFLLKKMSLEELQEESKELLEYESKFGGSVAIEKSKIRIEEMKMELVKEMIEMLNS